MQLPKDPILLLSYINTKLRDDYSSLEELASSLGVNKEEIVASLSGIDYHYDPSQNQFK